MVFNFSNFCLRNYKFDISSREFVWEDGGAVMKSFLDMLKNQIWQNSYFKDSLLNGPHCIFAAPFRFNTNPKKLFLSYDYCFLVCLSDFYVSEAIWSKVFCSILKL